MADLQLLLQQLTQDQINLQNHIMALANAQAAPAAAACKKVVADPGTYDGSPAKFHEWWSKIKIWMQVSMRGATDAKVAAAVYSQLTGPKAGCGLRSTWTTVWQWPTCLQQPWQGTTCQQPGPCGGT